MGSLKVFVLVLCCLIPLSVNAAKPEDARRGGVGHSGPIVPIHYRVHLMPFIWPGNFTTAGELDLLVECSHSTHNVILNSQDIDVLEDSVHIFLQDDDGKMGREIPLDPTEKFQVNPTEFIIKTSEELKAGSKYRIQMRFIAQLNDRLQGFYRSSHVDAATGEKRWIAVSQLAPRYARKSFPCFDKQNFKATFEFSLARRVNMTSLSNMPLDRSEPVEGMPGWVWDHYKTTPPMTIKLAAYMVFDFERLQRSDEGVSAGDSVPFNIWSRPDVLNKAKYAGAIAPPILPFYEEYFHTPYPLPKLDLVAVPEFIFTTMENYGLIVFRESMMLFDPKETTTRIKQRIAMDIAHDVAHQWIGDLVSPYWWDEAWLDESFCNYMEYVGAEYVEPTWRLSEQFPFNEIQKVFILDALESSHPVHMEVIDPEIVGSIFDSISYIKGACLMRTLNHSLGESTFRGGLGLYFKAHGNASADQDDLWQSLTTQAHLDGTLPTDMTVKEVMDSWTRQTGFPVVTVNRNYESGFTSFTQERFLLYKAENRTNSENSPKWWVPVTYTTQDNPDFTNTRPIFWLKPNDEQKRSIVMSPGEKWILVNIQETGYYRVNYDAMNWKLLTDQLKLQAGAKEQVIPPSARSQLLDDAFNLARSGLLPYSTALDLCLTLRNDIDYLPWASTFRALTFLDEMLTDSPIYGKFKELMLRLSRELVESVGWEDSENEHVKSLTRDFALRWSCHWGDEKCIDEAKKRFSHWMKSYEANNESDYRIAPDLWEVVYCNGIRYGSTSEWEFVWQRYKDSKVGTERTILFNSLSCTRDTSLLERYVGMLLDRSPGISNQDGRIVFTPITFNPLASSLLFDSLKNKWEDVQKTQGSNIPHFSEIIVTATNYMTTPDQLAQLQQFWKDHEGSLGPMRRNFKYAIDKVQANVKWMERSYEEVKIWIEKQQ